MIDWKTEMIWATIAWRIDACNEQIPLNTVGTEYHVIDDDLTEMFNRNILAISDDKQRYVIGKQGRDVLTKYVAMFDQAMRYEIFSAVELDIDLEDLELDEENNVADHVHDVRFLEQETQTSEDLRLAMIDYAIESVKREKNENVDFDARKVVFLQLIIEKKLSKGTKPFWFDLKMGDVFDAIQTLCNNAYGWRDLGNDDEESWELARQVYCAGLIEQRKRNGAHCSLCNTPLAIFEAIAQEEGKELLECPNPDCDGDFRDPTQMGLDGDPEYECPRCQGDIRSGQSTCYKCGANVDFSMPMGSEEDEEIIEEEIMTTNHYDYVPYGYYDPWDPTVDAVALAFLCGSLI